MRAAARLVLAAVLARAALAGEVQVRPNGELLDVVATAAPLADVLARLSQQTGMKVVYDGAPPRTLVTATLPRRTPVEAVLALFEGLGLNYALKTDASGTKVDTLIVTGPAPSAAASRAAAPPPQAATTPEPRRPPFQQPPARPQPGAEPDEPEGREEAEEADENAARPQPEKAPSPPSVFNGPIPGPGNPGSPFGSGQIGPLRMPTPAPPPAALPAPGPSPTPSPGR
jgi:hypothetical protein